MRARQISLAVAAVAALTALVACKDDGTSAPDLVDAPAIGTSGGTGAGGGTGGDSTSAPLVTFELRGRVHSAAFRTPTAPGADSVVLTPLAGATLELFRHVLVNGQGTQVRAGGATSAADGTYRFESLAGGYYSVKAIAPAGAALNDSWAYAAGTAPVVTANLYLWPRR